MKRINNRLLCIFVAGLLLILAGCSSDPQKVSKKDDLMASLNKTESIQVLDFTNEESSKQPEKYDRFVSASTGFSIKLLKNTVKNGENTVISPLSVSLALGMTGNGAAGTTLKEFRKLLGNGLDYNTLNSSYSYLSQRLQFFNNEASKLNIANSIWYNNDVDVKRTFLQKNIDHFSAGAYKLDFSDENTLPKINNWVSEKTDGQIEKILDKLDTSSVMYLINTVFMDAKWSNTYTKSQISDGVFHAPDGDVNAVFMSSAERYFKGNDCTGFIKNIDNIPCRFVAILPDEGINLGDFTQSLTATTFLELINYDKKPEFAKAVMPQFKFEYSTGLKDALVNSGIPSAFSAADASFTNMTPDKVFIKEVYHKVKIEVSPEGIKAGAATAVEVNKSAGEVTDHEVKLDRPFIFAVVDNESNIPIFMGIVNKP